MRRSTTRPGSVVAAPPREPGSDRDGRTPPRWAVLTAHLVPLAILPCGLWRVALALGLPLGLRYDGAAPLVGTAESASIIGLSLLSELAALLTFALVRPWGERLPSWLPLLGGRRIPPYAAIVPAAVGAAALQAIWAFAFRDFPSFGGLTFSHPGWEALMIGCYLPALLWAPLLAAVTWAYYRRRCRD